MKYGAYWLDPTGKLLPVAVNHIAAIIKNPEIFGLTTEYIHSVYEECGERIGREGEARLRLILEVLEKGFIRIRFYKTYWAVTVNNINPENKVGLFEWLNINGTKYHTIKLNLSSKNGKSLSVRRLSEGSVITFNSNDEFKSHLENL